MIQSADPQSHGLRPWPRAAEHHNEFSLDDYHHHVRMVLGCGIDAAVREMARRIATGRLLLIRRGKAQGDAVVIDHHDFSINYDLEFDGEGWLRIVAPDPNLPGVKRMALAMDDFDYSVIEQDVPAQSRPPTATLSSPGKPITSAKKTKPATPAEPGETYGDQLVSLMQAMGLPKSGLRLSEVRKKVRPRFKKKYPDGAHPDDVTINRAYKKYKNAKDTSPK